MISFPFTQKDVDQITETGHDPDQVMSQLTLFEKGAPFARLDRPCTVGDGIRVLSEDERRKCLETDAAAAESGKTRLKFVPASGAATRMFKKLITAFNAKKFSDDTAFFFENIRKFAFYEDLRISLFRNGQDVEALLAHGDHETVLRYLLTRDHLNYAGLPKGLIKFHAYDEGSRTAFEEHLVEAAGYARCGGACALHFTVPPAHRDDFRAVFESLQAARETRHGVRFRVDFSIQSPSTDTIAVDMDNRPFRLADGRLLFRPGGHGALIHNLHHLDADIVFIKNIDNVAHESHSRDILEWKKILCGFFIRLQNRIFSFLHQLHRESPDTALFQDISDFLGMELGLPREEKFTDPDPEKQKNRFIHLLNRPLRVCGMVENTGAPGGGPFWTRIPGHGLSRQIVETAQINMQDPDQKAVFNRLTHFNPVDLVCGLKDFRGRPFDLNAFVDPEAVFITHKSENGRDLKALELPGLWNGAMAFWNTVFVEVPGTTFNPVKEVTDLLGLRHQPAS